MGQQYVGAIMLATSMTFFIAISQSARAQQMSPRDCLAEAYTMTGSERRNFLFSCLQDGGVINCPPQKKLCGIRCIFRAKVCAGRHVGGK